MIRHVVLLRFRGDETEAAETAASVAEALRALPAAVPSIRSYRVELDAGLVAGNAHLAVTAEFDDEQGFADYTLHPAHVGVIDTLIKPALDLRCALQSSH